MDKHHSYLLNLTEKIHTHPPNYSLLVITEKKSLMSTALSTWDNEGGALSNNLQVEPYPPLN